MNPSKPLSMALAVALALAASSAFTDEDCDGCGDTNSFPEAQAFLDGHGYPADEYTLLFAWFERSRVDADTLVAGYRLRGVGESQAFDVYSNASGNLLSENDLSSLGIPPKNWNIKPVEQAAVLPKKVAKAVAPRPSSKAQLYNRSTSDTAIVPAIDLKTVLAEDAQRRQQNAKSPTRIGVVQGLVESITVDGAVASHGAWEALPDGGQVWTIDVFSPEAKAQRIHIKPLQLPAGSQFIVYNAATPDEAYGPYASADDVWTATCFGDLVTLECYVPAGVSVNEVSLTVTETVHVYADFSTIPWGAITKASGSCNNDVTCFPAWADTALGIGALGYVSNPGFLFCTGTLIADTDDSTDIPYVLTANHCVGSQSEASTTEVYWMYQSSVCDGSIPNPVTVPRTTGGADLLATTVASTGTDFCLLRLNNDAASGTTYVGWSSAEAPVGTEVVCVHHPSQDAKKISFADITNFAESLLGAHPRERYHQSLWYDGTTEGGSSGSPLMIESTHQIVGQLWGGLASCSATSSPDYYGRFDVSYPLMESWLDPEVPEPDVDFASTYYSTYEYVGMAILTVELSQAPGTGQSCSVDYATADDTASAGTDYTAASGTLTFSDDETSKTITLTIASDTTHEYDEKLTVTLSNASGCNLAGTNNPAILTIVDDDVDSDGDYISDYDETNGTLGYVTDPNDDDSDGDGVMDYYEYMSGTDPTDPGDTPTLASFPVPFFVDRE